MRDAYTETMTAMARADEALVVLDADLMNSIGMRPFARKFPERTFNCGVQEANMIGVAAGLSATGKKPFAHTFGPFATRRCCDQVFVSAAYAGLNVKIIGSDPGITATFNGGTHMPFEDMGIMRGIPSATVIDPTDNAMFKNLLWQIKDLYGVYYMRMMRKEPYKIYDEGDPFAIGRGIVLRDGGDVAIFASGILVREALEAAKGLYEQGVNAAVINLFTWKPLDRELILQYAARTGAVVTAENHNVINGLGSAVAEVLCESAPTPLGRIGSQDRFGQVGTQDYLLAQYHMTARDIAEKALETIARKA